ncbi:MAG TPA: hypothetical protein VGM13_10505 [Thermoanaerobaculia bacterium]
MRVLLVLSFAAAFSAPAATIPPDLEARATELRRQASPQMLAWVHEQGVALARTHGPVDVAALEQTIRSRFAVKRAPAGRAAAIPSGSYANLGATGDGDIMAIAFIVMMEAAKSAQEDLKEIMGQVKAINNAKAQQRGLMREVNPASGAKAATPAPTPTPDRVAQLVAAARNVHGKTHGANLSAVAHR